MIRSFLVRVIVILNGPCHADQPLVSVIVPDGSLVLSVIRSFLVRIIVIPSHVVGLAPVLDHVVGVVGGSVGPAFNVHDAGVGQLRSAQSGRLCFLGVDDLPSSFIEPFSTIEQSGCSFVIPEVVDLGHLIV